MTITSPRRSGCVIAIISPATQLASVERAAKPITRPITAVDASSPPATARTCGITSSAERIPTIQMIVVIVRRSTR